MRPLSHVEYLSLRRFPALDGLRAIAALMVVDFHFDGRWPWLAGWIGVHVFFVLSGFLITTLLLREEQTYGRISFRNFYLRRAFRIIPVYYVVIGLSWLLWVHLGGSRTFDGTLRYYLTFTSDRANSAPLVHTWTISIEQKFYLVWPLLAFSVTLLRRLRVVVTTALVVGLAVFLPNIPGFSFVHYDVLLFGCLLAMLMHDKRGFAVVRVLTIPWVSFVVSVAFIATHIALTMVHPLNQQRWISLYAIALVVLLPGLLGRGLPARLLANPVLRFIGDRSYSLYLTQILAGIVAQSLFPKDGRGHTQTLIVAVIALAMADVLYRWVEQPMIRVGRRLTERRRPEVPRQPAALPEPVAAEPRPTLEPSPGLTTSLSTPGQA